MSNASAIPSSEKGGTFVLRFIFKLGGVYLCYIVAIFPLIFFYATGYRERKALRTFYRRRAHYFKSKVFIGRSFANYWSFGCTLIDRMSFMHKPDKVNRFIQRDEFNYKLEPHSQHGSFILGAHIGDWILCGAGLKRYNLDISIVMNAATSPQFQKITNNLKSFGVKIIPSQNDPLEVLLAIRDCLDQGGNVCMMGDRLDHSKRHVAVNFLGKEAEFPADIFEIARILKRPIFQFLCIKSGPFPWSKYVISSICLWDGKEPITVQDLIRKYVQSLEMCVETHPSQWFNFFDFWKTANAN